MIDLKNIAYALGGEINRDQVLAPGPNHSRQDRSLSIKLALNPRMDLSVILLPATMVSSAKIMSARS